MAHTFIGTHHKALCVTSGYWVGPVDKEREVINMSGNFGSGTVTMNSIAPIFDFGIAGLSGHITSYSTKIASIATANVANYGPLATAHSGIMLHVSWSGNLLNIYKYSVDGSAATSSQVVWQAWG
jgi:hypothetical protein